MANYKSSYTKLKETIKSQKERIDLYEVSLQIYENALFEIAWLNPEQIEKGPEIAKITLIEVMNLEDKNETR